MSQTLDIQLEPILEPRSGINGPTNALGWLEPSLLNEALRYFANLQVESRDEQEIAYANLFYDQTNRLYKRQGCSHRLQNKKTCNFFLQYGTQIE